MAIAARFTITFNSADGREYTARILDNEWPSAAQPMTIGGDKFSISYKGEDTGRDRFAPIVTSQATLRMLFKPDTTGMNLFLGALFGHQEDRFYLEILRASGDPRPVVWRGKIIQDLIKHGDIEESRFLEITASDGLNGLSTKIYEDLAVTKPQINFADLFVKALKLALPVEMWETSDIYMVTCARWFEDSHPSALIDPLRYTSFIPNGTLINMDGDLQTDDQRDVKEILEICLKAWGLRLFQADGRWHIIQNAQYKNASVKCSLYTYEYFQFSNTDPDDDNQAGATFVDNTTLLIEQDWTYGRFGNEYTYLPALREVRVTYEHEALNDIANTGRIFNIDDLGATGYDVATFNSFGSNSIEITIYTKIDDFFSGSTLPNPNTWQQGLLYTIKYGGYYLTNANVWTTTPTPYLVTATFLDYGNWATCDSNVVIVASIPASTGTLNISLSPVTLNPTVYLGPQYPSNPEMHTTINLRYAAVIQPGQTEFVAINTDAPNSTVIADLGTVIIGDYPNSSGKYALNVYDGSAWSESEEWQFEKTGTKYNFGLLLVRDYLSLQKRPLRKYMGEISFPYSFAFSFVRDGRSFMIMSGEFNPIYNTWRGEWVETDYDSSGITTSDTPLGLEGIDGTGRGGIVLKTYSQVNTIGGLGLGHDEGDEISSILISTLPSDLTGGGKVTLFNQTTGQSQVLTIGEGGASAGSSVEVPIVTTTLNANYTVGSEVLLSATNALDTFITTAGGGGATQLSELSDVDASVATPSDGNILVYRSAGNDWVLEAKPAAGSNPAINDITDVSITSVADNEVLAYNSGTGEWINQTAAEAGLAAASHTHAASDVTSGTFADARIAQSNVTQHQAALSIGNAQVTGLGALALKSSVNNADWSGTDLAVTNGGTGASTATDARTNLGLAIGTNVQAYSAVLSGTTASFTTAKDSKLTGIEAGADVTDTANVTSAGAVMVTGAQTVAGVKTFSSFPVTPSAAPTTDYEVANKKFVVDSITAGGGYTDEDAQDAVGNILTDTATIDLTYNDAAGTITADVKPASIGTASLSTGVNTSLGLADSATQPGDLATVATTGAYADLTGKPTLGSLAALNTVNNDQWSGIDLAIVNGGTGASSASAARTNLGLVIGTNVQAHSAVLDATTASFTTAKDAAITANTAKISFDAASSAKLATIETGAEVNNISDVNATDLTDGGASTLHYHTSDRNRTNHTGTQLAATISDFTTSVQAVKLVTATRNVNFTLASTENNKVVELDAGLDTVTLPTAIAGLQCYLFNKTGGDVFLVTPDYGDSTIADGTMCLLIGLPASGWYARQL